MKLATILVIRNKSCHVRTLHTIMALNQFCLMKGNIQDITFVDDDRFKITDIITKKLKDSQFDRILFFDYGISVQNHETIQTMINTFENYNCLVLPCVTEGIDWTMFKQKVLADDSNEPTNQLGLNFDTEVNKKIKDDIYSVTATTPKCWSLDCKPVLRALHKKGKSSFTLPPENAELFKKFIAKGVKIGALTTAEVVTIFAHECLGNIIHSAGLVAQ
jgi:hypothetical protein